ncbi:hypothetical protein BT96DRAFT_944591 [Gymnopus androsaceus JB14]|uniref:Uncharacterized protein n=1 Tax=Gymnopus androsaceus JB14 TaxID=1447944 RepID=A0A6A4H5F3_9AGAR|nr:hypothetical protein BT96DRAFT_944591 [Gymnopus androsaceus JB14]
MPPLRIKYFTASLALVQQRAWRSSLLAIAAGTLVIPRLEVILGRRRFLDTKRFLGLGRRFTATLSLVAFLVSNLRYCKVTASSFRHITSYYRQAYALMFDWESRGKGNERMELMLEEAEAWWRYLMVAAHPSALATFLCYSLFLHCSILSPAFLFFLRPPLVADSVR